MQGKDKITDAILSGAHRSASAMVDEATQAAAAVEESVRAELESAKKQTELEIKTAADAVYAGAVKLGELERTKITLKARQACVTAVYDRVRELILSQKDADYLAMLKSLIVSVCEDGDEVIAAKADAKRVTAEWVKKVATSAKKKLTLSKTHGEFDGGVILRNKKYDRDLTIDEIVNDLRERTEKETVEKLGL